MPQKYLRWIPALLWYRVIWGFSAQNADISGSLSDRLLWRLMVLLSPVFSAADPQAQTDAVELLSFAERKAAHMFLYFVLILLLWLAVAPLLRCRRRQLAVSAALCGVLASLDESHQLLVPGRSGQVQDVLIDLTGAAIALALSGLLLWMVRCRRAGKPFFPAWLSVCLCVLLIAAIASPFGDAASLALAQGAVSPETVAPLLREFLFLMVCGLLGCCAAFSAALSGLPFRGTLGCALLPALLLPGAVSFLLGPGIFFSATALSLLGCMLFSCLWLACLGLLPPAKGIDHADNAQSGP